MAVARLQSSWIVIWLTVILFDTVIACLYFGHAAVAMKTELDSLIVSRVQKSDGFVVFDDQLPLGAIDLYNLPNDVHAPRHDSSKIGWIARLRRHPVYIGFRSDESYKGRYGANDRDFLDVAPFLSDLQGLSLCGDTTYSKDDAPSTYRSSINISDGIVPVLCSMTRLKYLAVDRTDISAAGLGQIAAMPSIGIVDVTRMLTIRH